MEKMKAMLSQPMAGKSEEEIVATRNKAIKVLEDMGYEDVEYFVVEGKMPCAIAVISTNK